MPISDSGTFHFRFCGTIIVLFSGMLAACGDSDARARTELRELEIRLDAISVESDPNWKNKLTAASRLSLETPELVKIQRMCVSAYREYADAMAEMASANRQLKELEHAVSQGQIEGLEEKHSRTRLAIEETTRHLEQSQVLIQACMNERQEVRGRYKVVRN